MPFLQTPIHLPYYPSKNLLFRAEPLRIRKSRKTWRMWEEVAPPTTNLLLIAAKRPHEVTEPDIRLEACRLAAAYAFDCLPPCRSA
jgi:hypothetical protein